MDDTIDDTQDEQLDNVMDDTFYDAQGHHLDDMVDDAHDSDGYANPPIIDDDIKGKRTRRPTRMHEITHMYSEGQEK